MVVVKNLFLLTIILLVAFNGGCTNTNKAQLEASSDANAPNVELVKLTTQAYIFAYPMMTMQQTQMPVTATQPNPRKMKRNRPPPMPANCGPCRRANSCDCMARRRRVILMAHSLIAGFSYRPPRTAN